MSYTLRQVAKEPIFIGTFYPPLDAFADPGELLHELNQLAECIVGTVYYIGDTSRVELNFDKIACSLRVPSDELRPTKIRYLAVASDIMSELAALSWEPRMGRDGQILLVSSVEEGIEYARTQIAEAKSLVSPTSFPSP